MDLYVTVSSGPTSGFPFNSTTYSQYFLEKPIQLEGEYEVALVETTFKNVFSNSLASFKFFRDENPSDGFIVNMDAKDGENFYSVIQNFNKMLSDEYLKLFFKTIYNYDKISSDSITIPNFVYLNDQYELKIPIGYKIELLNILDDKLTLTKNETNVFCKFKDEKFSLPKHFFVSSDLIDDQYFGEEMFPLLTNFCLENNYNNIYSEINYKFDSPKYIKVNKQTISEFDLKYFRDLHSDIYHQGTIITTLHLRKIKNGL